MANSLSSLNPYFWAREAERSLFVENSAMLIANTTLRNLVAGEGSLVYRQIISYPSIGTYTPGSNISNQNLSSSSESLSIATWFASRVTVDDTEKRQSIIDIGANVAKKMMANFNNQIEQAVLGQISNAQWSLDDGNVGGTAGNNIVLNTSNVPQVFTAADTKLDAIDAPKNLRTAVVGGHFLGQLKLQQAARATNFGDVVTRNGEVGQLFGWNIVYSNNLPYHAKLAIGTNPTNLDTVTIAGVTFTFVSSIGSTAGNVLIGNNANASIQYLCGAINDTNSATADSNGGWGVAGSQYVALSSENRFLVRDKRRLTATASDYGGGSATYLVIDGYGDIVVSETLTAPADVWSAQRQNALFGTKGCVDQIVQIPPKIEVVRDPYQFADIVKGLLGYGVKTFADGAREMVNVKIDASTSDWA